MRHALPFLLFCLACCPTLLAQPASLEGTVVHSTTGAPLSHVHVKLALQNPDEDVAPIYGAITDDRGHFSMAAVQSGVAYVLEAERTGFLLYPTVEQAARGVIVRSFKPGEQVTGFRLEMAPRVVITGRVLDENGEPLPGAHLLARRVPQATPTHWSPTLWANSDDRGMFRLVVVPDRYRIVCGDASDTIVLDNALAHVDSNETAEIRTDGSSDNPYLWTYYPSTVDPAAATIVEARAGADVAGIDIRPVHSAMLYISGSVSGLPDSVKVRVRLKSKSGHIERNETAAPDGKFAFSKLDPGVYRIYAESRGGELQSAVQELTLSNAGADFVSLALVRGFEVTGTVGGAPANAPGEREVSLIAVRTESDPGEWMGRTSAIEAGGRFQFSGVQPGEYEAIVRPLRDGAYVNRLQLNGRDVPDGVVTLREGAKLTLTIATNGGEVSGTLTGTAGEAIHRTGFVYLVKDGADLAPRQRFGEETEADGTFRVASLPPGKYRIFADVAGITPMSPEMSAGQRLQGWMAGAEVIEIHEGEKLVRNVKVVGAK